MLGEIILKEVIAKLRDDEDDKPKVRLGFHPDVDTVTVNMYRRAIIEGEDGDLVHTVSMRVLTDTVKVEGKPDSTLFASVTIDKGDLIDAVAYITGAADRIRTRADVEAKAIEEKNKNLPLTLAETTSKEANKRFEKLYAEFEQVAADLRESQAQLAAARAEGLSPDIEITEIDLTAEKEPEEEIVPVGASGDAEDETT